MRGLDSSKLLVRRKKALRFQLAVRQELVKSVAFAAGSFFISGATLFGQALPLAACVTAALPIGLQGFLAAFGAICGYFLHCEAALAAEYTALTLLMLAASTVFQGTGLLSARWFMPCMAAGVCAVLGGISVLGGGLQISLLVTKVLLAFLATAAFHKAFAGNRRAAMLPVAAILSGLSGLPLSFDLGLAAACALCAASAELSTAAVVGLALDLTGNYGHCALPALIFPQLLCRLLRKNDRSLTVLTCVLMPSVVLLCFARLSVGLFLAVTLGGIGGLVLKRFLPQTVFSRAHRDADGRLEEAANVLETLCKHLPEEVFSVSHSEAEEVYDAAAERVCRCCPRFHRCWEHYAAQTYESLSAAAHRIIEKGVAEAEDFPKNFRDHCCHMEGFVIALNQELEGMLYRRRYRMQLRESRQVLGLQLRCLAEYLRTAQNESETQTAAFSPQIGVCTLGKDGSRVSGDRGAYFAGLNGDFYVLLCDGMGTGEGASASSKQTVRLLQSLLHSGLAPESALQMLNGAEILRGTGCYTTVDLLRIDLNSGAATLYKWGAAASYLREFDEIKRFGTQSTPPGVGLGYAPEQYAFTLKHGQMLVLVSDGADGQEVETTLSAYCGSSSRELAALLLAAARGDDDMSAVTVCLRPSA